MILNLNIKNNYALLFSFFIYEILISSRILLEAELPNLTPQIFIHQLFWFNFVLFWYAIAFRYISKCSLKQMPILGLGGLLPFIPILYGYITDTPIKMNYYQVENLGQTLFDIATFLYFHNQNHPMFFELICLCISGFVLSFLLTRNFLRSVVSAIFAFYGSFILVGISWISVSEEHPTMITLSSGFHPQTFYSMQLICMCLFLLSALFFSQIKKSILSIQPSRKSVIVSATSIVLLLAFLIAFRNTDLSIADSVVIATISLSYIAIPHIATTKNSSVPKMLFSAYLIVAPLVAVWA